MTGDDSGAARWYIRSVSWVRDRSQKLLFWMILFLGASILTLLTTPLDIPSLHSIQTYVLWPVHCIEGYFALVPVAVSSRSQSTAFTVAIGEGSRRGFAGLCDPR